MSDNFTMKGASPLSLGLTYSPSEIARVSLGGGSTDWKEWIPDEKEIQMRPTAFHIIWLGRRASDKDDYNTPAPPSLRDSVKMLGSLPASADIKSLLTHKNAHLRSTKRRG